MQLPKSKGKISEALKHVSCTGRKIVAHKSPRQTQGKHLTLSKETNKKNHHVSNTATYLTVSVNFP